MRIELTALHPGINELDIVLDKSLIDPEMAPLAQNGRLKLTVDNQESVLYIKGRVRARVALECARCLKAFRKDLEADIEAIGTLQGHSSLDEESCDEDILVFTQSDTSIDLTRLVTEELSTAMPMAAVCSESCAGLCPMCGINLNKEKCSCSTTGIDPRWEPLLKLKKE